ncbi:hypothetical protein [Shimazuella kribbensis]|uniref:hypothetical protein n=1 Tax=Shimazuella kribbensis TaxID=139808 RepID=UPI00048B3142|nr:hypothetical protein [Shimazuella kribbensis]
MAIIEFVYDKQGYSQALHTIDTIYERGKTDPVMADISYYVSLILDHLEIAGVPEDPDNYNFIFQRRNRSTITSRRIFKELKYHIPLIELRYNHYVDGNPSYAFRIIFFEANYQGKTVIFITRALLKKEKSDVAFDRYCIESDKIFQDFLRNPHHYLETEEDEE